MKTVAHPEILPLIIDPRCKPWPPSQERLVSHLYSREAERIAVKRQKTIPAERVQGGLQWGTSTNEGFNIAHRQST